MDPKDNIERSNIHVTGLSEAEEKETLWRNDGGKLPQRGDTYKFTGWKSSVDADWDKLKGKHTRTQTAPAKSKQPAPKGCVCHTAPVPGRSGGRKITRAGDSPMTTWGQAWSKILTTEGQSKGMFLEGDESLDRDGGLVHADGEHAARVR